MHEEEELAQYLPSVQIERLSQAIGRGLLEVTRWLVVPLDRFLVTGRFPAQEYFARSAGPVQLDFAGDLSHTLDVWAEQLSILVLPDPIAAPSVEDLVCLSESAAPPTLRACLGQTCLDVRIWTLAEEIESDEARQVALSYLFSNGVELFYCTYLHGDLSSDYLLLGPEVPRRQVRSCFSIAQGGYLVNR
jgi:hypothetical protein